MIAEDIKYILHFDASLREKHSGACLHIPVRDEQHAREVVDWLTSKLSAVRAADLPPAYVSLEIATTVHTTVEYAQ